MARPQLALATAVATVATLFATTLLPASASTTSRTEVPAARTASRPAVNVAPPGTGGQPPATKPAQTIEALRSARSWTYQLQGYNKGKLDQLAAAKRDVVVIDLARDAQTKWFRADEIASLKASGSVVLAYFEIGSIEDFRPELATIRKSAPDLLANRWSEWPDETFVRYWDQRWWDLVVRPRIDQALAAGFDGVYLDTPLAYEELDLAYAGGRNRDQLASLMVDLIRRISDYGRAKRPGFAIVPQNSPELYTKPGYLSAIDALAMEELWYQATDIPCTESYCAENLAAARAVRAAGKPVFSVDYAKSASRVAAACKQSRAAGFVPYVGPLELHRIAPACP